MSPFVTNLKAHVDKAVDSYRRAVIFSDIYMQVIYVHKRFGDSQLLNLEHCTAPSKRLIDRQLKKTGGGDSVLSGLPNGIPMPV